MTTRSLALVPDWPGLPWCQDWPAWAEAPAEDDGLAVPVAWVPIRSRRGGAVPGEQLALRLV